MALLYEYLTRLLRIEVETVSVRLDKNQLNILGLEMTVLSACSLFSEQISHQTLDLTMLGPSIAH